MADYSQGLWELQDDGTIIVKSQWLSIQWPYIAVMSITKEKKMVPRMIKKNYDTDYRKRRYRMATFILSPSEVPDGSIVMFRLEDASWANDAVYYAEIDRSYYTDENKRPYKELIDRRDAKRILWARLKEAEKRAKSPSGVRFGARDSREIRILSSEPDLSEIKGVGPSITQAVTDIYGTTSVSELLKVDGFLESLGDIRTDSGRKIPKSTLNNIRNALNSFQ